MSHAVWVRVSFLLVCAAVLVAAIHERRETADAEPGAVQGRQVTGVTSQRERIRFGIDERGRPRFLMTRIWAECPGTRDRGTYRGPADAVVPFRWEGNVFRVRESKRFDYENGVRGMAAVGLDARATHGRIEGQMRAYWQFLGDGSPYLECDSGSVSFRAGSLDEPAR